MAILSLPASATLKSYTFNVTLQGTNFNFRFWWNTRDVSWYFDIYDAGNALIVAGQKLTVDWSWLDNVVDARRPLGKIAAVDTTNEGEAGLNDLGERIQLVYIEG